MRCSRLRLPRTITLLTAWIVLTPAVWGEEKPRVWRDRNNKNPTTATLVDFDEETVTLRKDGREQFTLKRSQLSRADGRYLDRRKRDGWESPQEAVQTPKTPSKDSNSPPTFEELIGRRLELGEAPVVTTLHGSGKYPPLSTDVEQPLGGFERPDGVEEALPELPEGVVLFAPGSSLESNRGAAPSGQRGFVLFRFIFGPNSSKFTRIIWFSDNLETRVAHVEGDWGVFDANYSGDQFLVAPDFLNAEVLELWRLNEATGLIQRKWSVSPFGDSESKYRRRFQWARLLPDGGAVIECSRRVRIVSSEGHIVKELTGTSGHPAVSQDGRLLAVADRGNVRIIETRSLTTVKSIPLNKKTKPVVTAFSTDGSRLIVSGDWVEAFDAKTWSPVDFFYAGGATERSLTADWIGDSTYLIGKTEIDSTDGVATTHYATPTVNLLLCNRVAEGTRIVQADHNNILCAVNKGPHVLSREFTNKQKTPALLSAMPQGADVQVEIHGVKDKSTISVIRDHVEKLIQQRGMNITPSSKRTLTAGVERSTLTYKVTLKNSAGQEQVFHVRPFSSYLSLQLNGIEVWRKSRSTVHGHEKETLAPTGDETLRQLVENRYETARPTDITKISLPDEIVNPKAADNAVRRLRLTPAGLVAVDSP